MKGAVIKMNAVNNPMGGVFCDAVTQADGVNHTRNARKTGGHEMRERVLSAVVCVFLPILAAVASCENMDFSRGLDGWSHVDQRWSVDPDKGRNRSAAAVWKGSDGQYDEQLKRSFPVEAGNIYRVGVWAKTVDLKLNGMPTKPILCCGYSDKNGKYLGSFWGSEVMDNATDTDGWRYYMGITPPLPSGAALLTVALTFRGGVAGTVLFDDVGIERVGSKPIAYVVSSRYRDEAVDGSVVFHSLLQLNLVKHPIASLRPEFRYRAADGRARKIAPSVLKAAEASVSLNVADLAMGRQNIIFVIRDASGEVVAEASCPFTRLAKPRLSHVWFDEHGRTWVEGKKFFPLGFYSPGDGNPQRWAPYYAHLTNGVINCLLPYYDVSLETIRQFDKAGVKTIYSLREWIWGARRCKRDCQSHDASLAKIQDVVRKLRNEPGIIAWYVMDEAPPSQAAFLSELRGVLHEVDPGRPAYAVTDKPYDVRQFVASFDVIGMDPYPIGNHTGSKIDIASKWPIQAAEATWHTRPMWQVPQTFNWWWERKTEVNPEYRFPRRDELANMCYQAIAAGANGLVAFDLAGTTRKDKDGTTGFARTLEIYKEIKSQTDLFLSDPGPTVSSMPVGTIARTWRRENGTVSALVVNTTRDPAGGELACSGCERLQVNLPALGYLVTTLKEIQPK